MFEFNTFLFLDLLIWTLISVCIDIYIIAWTSMLDIYVTILTSMLDI